MKAEIKPSTFRVLTKVLHPCGEPTWEWLPVEGHEIVFDTVELKNGDSFSITYTELPVGAVQP